jgi:hypothetical protein
MVLKPPEAAQTPKTDPNKSDQTAFRYPARGFGDCHGASRDTGTLLYGPKLVRHRRVNGSFSTHRYLSYGF